MIIKSCSIQITIQPSVNVNIQITLVNVYFYWTNLTSRNNHHWIMSVSIRFRVVVAIYPPWMNAQDTFAWDLLLLQNLFRNPDFDLSYPEPKLKLNLQDCLRFCSARDCSCVAHCECTRLGSLQKFYLKWTSFIKKIFL